MVFEKIKEIIADTMACDPESITLDTNLREDLGCDSLDGVTLVMSAEDEFGIEIPDELAGNVKTVRDIVEYIEENK